MKTMKLARICLGSLACSGMLMLSAAPRLRADDECQKRVIKADHEVHEAIAKHGPESHEAADARAHLSEARSWCWDHEHKWWDEDAKTWHNQRDWNDHDHDHPPQK
jgi:hypothetical protein